MKVPVDKIFEYTKNNMKNVYGKLETKVEFYKEQIEQFEIMKQCNWEDIENLSKQDLEKIQIGWLYDWIRVTGHLDYECKVKELFKKHNLKILTPKEYLNKFDKKLPQKYGDVYNILPHFELKSYIKNFLLDDNEFINEVDCCMWGPSSDNKLINKSIKERIEYFSNTIGNEARTYILKILTLKHLTKILLNNLEGFTDEFWRERLNKVLKNKI